MLRIEIIDDSSEEGEAYHFHVPVDTDKFEIIRAIEIFYPTARSILFELEENSSDVIY